MSKGYSQSTDTSPYNPQMPTAVGTDILGQLRFFEQIEFNLIWDMAELICRTDLSDFLNCFEDGIGIYQMPFVSTIGEKKAKAEWPAVWKKLGLDSYTKTVNG